MTDLGHALRDTVQYHAAADAGQDDVQLIETHISWVLLAGDFAWKVKKPVKLEFADFSTLARRCHFCREELRLNRRLAPDLYLDVVPLTGTVESPVLEGGGNPIDFAVKMRRFPQEQLLTEVTRRGELSPQHIDSLAEAVALFHQRLDPAGSDSESGTPESVWQPVRANFEYFDLHVSDDSRRESIAAIQERMMQNWSSLADECTKRREGGFVRECHGDMHLGNMVLLDDRVTVFDAIDFNPEFRWIDVMSEIAFVVMDLQRRGCRDLAHRFLNLYSEQTGDYGGLQLLPFYVGYRAMVRAKVQAIRFSQRDGQINPTTAEQEVFDTLVRLASASTEHKEPQLLITHGFSGSGKTTITQTLLERIGAIRIRSDVERQRLATTGRLSPNRYSDMATELTYGRLERLADQLLDTGLPVIVDATFLKQNLRERFRDLAARHDARFAILACEAPVDVLRSRILNRHQTGQDASEADREVLDQQVASHEPISVPERKHAICAETTQPVDSIVAAIREMLPRR